MSCVRPDSDLREAVEAIIDTLPPTHPYRIAREERLKRQRRNAAEIERIHRIYSGDGGKAETA